MNDKLVRAVAALIHANCPTSSDEVCSSCLETANKIIGLAAAEKQLADEREARLAREFSEKAAVEFGVRNPIHKEYRCPYCGSSACRFAVPW